MSGLIACVALDLPLAQWFDFSLPDARPDDLGRLVVVPFGKNAGKKMVGVIVAITDKTAVPAEKLRAVETVRRDLPALGAEVMALIRFCEGYYHAPFGQIALGVIPPLLRNAGRMINAPRVKPARPVSKKTLLTMRHIAITPAGREAMLNLPGRSVAQRAMLHSVLEGALPESALRQRHARAGVTLKTLLEKSWVRVEIEQAPVVSHHPRIIGEGPPLNAGQQLAVDAIAAQLGQVAAFLLEGITGSGKTEVYLRAIADVLRQGRQALVLVPEINLTPAFLQHVRTRFPAHHIAPAHSGMAAGARLRAWREAQDGIADIVVGTRLAIFTPMPRLALIVVDEEHDQSFKQQEGVRYSARDVAVFRARESHCPVVLGSATPSIETLDNVARGRFTRLALTQRAVENATLPEVNFIHLDSEKAPDGLTDSLLRAIKTTITRGEQAMVFINRRGFAPTLVCGSCAWMPNCKRCSARLVFHRAAGKLKCHHCGGETRVPATCKECGAADLHPAGQGSERIEAALMQAMPAARIARVDRDATRRRGSAEKIFAAAASGDIDILVGTQMLAKGHDFPKLTLVAVVNADSAVFSADFRAAERMAQQLTQVAGRSGRAGLSGRVLIQTRFPEHPVYQAVASHDYTRFVQVALGERKLMHLPPYSYLALLRAEARDVGKLDQFFAEAQTAAIDAMTHHKIGDIKIWEPVPATLARKAGYTRKQLMVQSDRRITLQSFLAVWLGVIRANSGRDVKWSIDVDPMEV